MPLPASNGSYAAPEVIIAELTQSQIAEDKQNHNNHADDIKDIAGHEGAPLEKFWQSRSRHFSRQPCLSLTQITGHKPTDSFPSEFTAAQWQPSQNQD
jgi:hypothetical protein